MLEERKAKMDEKEKKRYEMFEKQNENRKKEMNMKLEKQHGKLENAKKSNENILIQTKLNFDKKQETNEKRRVEFETKKENFRKEMAKRANEKQQEIQNVLIQNETQEEKKKMDYFKKQEEINKRKMEIEKMNRSEQIKKVEEQRKKAENIVKVRENNDALVENRKHYLMSKFDETDKKVERVHSEKQYTIERKKDLNFLKQLDREENAQRINLIKEMRSQRIVEKLEKDNLRTQLIQNEKSEMIRKTALLRKKMNDQRQQMLSEFEKSKMKNKFGTSTMSLTEFNKNNSLGPTLTEEKEYNENTEENAENNTNKEEN